MYAMDHTTHFEHRNESRPARRFLRRAEAAKSSPTTGRTSNTADPSDRERSETAPWPFPEFAD